MVVYYNSMPAPLPFPNGSFQGKGHWIDQKAAGDYTAQYSIADGPDESKVHTVHRVFFKPDGAKAYDEHSTVTFKPEEKGMTVRIKSERGAAEGAGYSIDNHCHYELDLSPAEHLEFTFTVHDGQVTGLGSSTNKGNFTFWTETLTQKT